MTFVQRVCAFYKDQISPEIKVEKISCKHLVPTDVCKACESVKITTDYCVDKTGDVFQKVLLCKVKDRYSCVGLNKILAWSLVKFIFGLSYS